VNNFVEVVMDTIVVDTDQNKDSITYKKQEIIELHKEVDDILDRLDNLTEILKQKHATVEELLEHQLILPGDYVTLLVDVWDGAGPKVSDIVQVLEVQRHPFGDILIVQSEYMDGKYQTRPRWVEKLYE
jgi:hypothetical protein